MENKINVAELLKDCPHGMELDCVLFNNPVRYDSLDNDDNYPIIILTENDDYLYLTEEGYLYNMPNSKCVIFPKGKTTWEGFQRPFKDGDILYCDVNDDGGDDDRYKYVFILKEINRDMVIAHCFINVDMFIHEETYLIDNNTYPIRLATKEEKEKLFKAIKENGYLWNTEAKTLKKLVQPKFKVGDEVKSIFNNNRYIITALTDTHYTLVEVENNFKYIEPIIEDKNWELASNKFDINTLVPFKSEVLVRMFNDGKWYPSFWGCYLEDIDCHYVTTKGNYKQCIPYEGNEHLLGKTDDCNEYYKNWE